MYKDLKSIIDPQLKVVEQHEATAFLSNKIKLSLYKKSCNSGIPTNILEEVYRRGYSIWNEQFKGTREQFAFDRVNSFVSGGFAADLDKDLLETEHLDKPTPSINQISKKSNKSLAYVKAQLKLGSKIESEHTSNKNIAKEIARDHLGEKPDYYQKLRKVESFETSEKQSKNANDSSSRFDGSKSVVNVYRQDTPGEPGKPKHAKKTLKVIKESLK